MRTFRSAIPLFLLSGILWAGDGDGGINQIVAPLTEAEAPGLAVMVRKNGRTVFARGYGVCDLRSKSKIDANTNFRLASFTKQFTATSIMLLVHDGKLHYNDSLNSIFPGFPDYGRSITIRHLLTHTSGLPDYEDLMGDSWSREHQIQDDEVLQILQKQTTPKFTAGSSWAYSNSAYVMLGLIVAKVSGKPFDRFLQERIFKPLGMNRTLLYINGRNKVPSRAYGHSKRDGRLVEADQSSTSATEGDGGVYSNLTDLAKWDTALLKHTLLSETEMRAAMTVAKLEDGSETKWPAARDEDNLNPGKPVSYGFGWFLDTWQGRPRMWHSGTTTGFRTAIDRFLAEKLTVVILANRTDIDAVETALKVAALNFQTNGTH